MKDYELTVLVKPMLSDKELDKEVKLLFDLLSKAGAQVSTKTDPKKQNLAYEIAKLREAYYIFMELQLKPEAVTAVDQKLKLEDSVIRYLLVRKE